MHTTDILLALTLVLSARQQGVVVRSLLRGRPLVEVEAQFRPLFTREVWATVSRIRLALQFKAIQCLPIWDFPKRFLYASPPLALFIRGDPRVLHQPAIGIVGARNTHTMAEQWTERFAGVQRACIVSGGAKGIDAAAHRGAMQEGLKTIAFLGVPADEFYPTHHAPLFERILASGGALVSEIPPGQLATTHHHAKRNRFIASQASTLVVVDASEKSGTLNTVRYAHSIGTPIRTAPLSVARHTGGLLPLLEQGIAHPIESTEVLRCW